MRHGDTMKASMPNWVQSCQAPKFSTTHKWVQWTL